MVRLTQLLTVATIGAIAAALKEDISDIAEMTYSEDKMEFADIRNNEWGAY